MSDPIRVFDHVSQTTHTARSMQEHLHQVAWKATTRADRYEEALREIKGLLRTSETLDPGADLDRAVALAEQALKSPAPDG